MATNERLNALGDDLEHTCQATQEGKNCDEEVCGARLARGGYHQHLCKLGPMRLRPHTNLENALGRLMREAGAKVDLERHVPHLYDKVERNGLQVTREAIMDVTVNFPGSWQTILVDVSIRCPQSGRYTDSGKQPAAASKAGESDKAQRYGQGALPLIFETFGRLGPKSLDTLRILADAAAVSGMHSTRRLMGWRRQLERAVIWSAAESTLLAYGSSARAALYSG